MSDSGGNTNLGREVGDTVHVRRPDGSTAAGTIVEDYADVAAPAELLGRDWAPAHRWAIALESGVLVFVDDDAFVGAPDDDAANSAP